MAVSISMARPRLGLSVSTTQGSELDAQGAQVTNVLDEGPAWEAGIREGDVITSIDGQSLFEALPGDAEDDFNLDESVPVQRLLAIARELEPGEEVEVTYLRDGDEREATVSAEDLSDRSIAIAAPEFDEQRLREQLRGLSQGYDRMRLQGPAPAPAAPLPPGATPGVRLWDRSSEPFFFDDAAASRGYGVELVELNAALGEYFGTAEGVLVVDVVQGSTLGLRPGDVILSVGDREVTAPGRLLRIFQSYQTDEMIPMRVRRDGREISVMGRLSN